MKKIIRRLHAQPVSRTEQQTITGGIIVPYRPAYMCSLDGTCLTRSGDCAAYCTGGNCIVVNRYLC